jgi:hypothetical protein
MDDELKIWMEAVVTNSKVPSRHFPGGTEEGHENLNQDSLCPGLQSKQARSEHKSRRYRLSQCARSLSFFLADPLLSFSLMIKGFAYSVGIAGLEIGPSLGLYLNNRTTQSNVEIQPRPEQVPNPPFPLSNG